MKETQQRGIIAQKKKELEKPQNDEKKPQTIFDFVNDPVMRSQIAKALPAVMTPERFTRIVLTALRQNPTLGDCNKGSFFAAVMQSAQLGLEPNTPLGQAYLIPYNNKKKNCLECQFQIGYKGLIDLAYRSGEVALIQAQTVYENDTFVYELGLEAKLIHKPFMTGDRGKAIAYYAIFKLKNGGENFAVMSRDDVIKFARDKSKSYDSGPWKTDFDAMAKKTVLKQVLKYAPIRTEALSAAVINDGNILLADKETGEVFTNGIEITEDEPISEEDETTPEEGEDAQGSEESAPTEPQQTTLLSDEPTGEKSSI